MEEVKAEFCQKLNCFLGYNGAGKTNLLDAIYYLSFTKSYFNSMDSYNVRHDSEFFMLDATYLHNEQEERVTASFKNEDRKKVFRHNKNAYKRFSDHIGLFPLAMISPADSSLIDGGGDERRKFMDGVISQYDKVFLEAFLKYNRVLLQRNTLLKQFAENHYFDSETLTLFDEQLAEYGAVIHRSRKMFLEELKPFFQHFYEFISNGKEQVSLGYESAMDSTPLIELLQQSRQRDMAVMHTSVGPHRDDLSFKLGEHPMKKIGSQGQTKTYLVALKFAQFEFMKNKSGIKPILLLDDIFDKLDARRVGKIIELVSNDQFGQIFITDTNQEHLDSILGQMNTQYSIYNISDGTVTPV